MMMMEFSDCLNEYEKLVVRMNMPRVVIDNGVCSTATVVKVDSARKQGILLESIQVLIDMNLSIQKAYISSDGRWNMDVFHVTDLEGNKISDEKVIGYIEKSIEASYYSRNSGYTGLTVLELTGKDRVGLLSEVFAVLAALCCDVVESKAWTHNGRIASLIYIKDVNSETPINSDLEKMRRIEGQLRNLLKGDDDSYNAAKTRVSFGCVTHTERRLHQMMFADRDYEKKFDSGKPPIVAIQNLEKRGYSVITLQCNDRAKLLFDIVCTLTDMKYIVFHAAIRTNTAMAFLEFYIRHMDGTPISSEPEKQRVIQCLQAAVERRTSKGVRLELHTIDKAGLLAEVTRTFRENGLNITRAEISTKDGMATNVFYVTDENGNQANTKIIESVREKIGYNILNLKKSWSLIDHEQAQKEETQQHKGGGAMLVSLGSLLRRNLYHLGLIKS